MGRRTDRVYDPLGLPNGRTTPRAEDVCPRCGGLLAEDQVLDPPRGFVSVPICMDDEGCGWRLWRFDLNQPAREQQVIAALEAGQSVDEVAEALGISTRTVFRIVADARDRVAPAERRKTAAAPTNSDGERGPAVADNGYHDHMGYEEFLRFRNAGRSRWAQMLLQIELEPMRPVKLPVKPGKNPSTDKTAIKKAARQLGIEGLDVINLGDALWVCILAESDAA